MISRTLTVLLNFDSTDCAKTIQWERILSINGSETTGFPYAKNIEVEPVPHTIHSNSKWIIGLNVTTKTIKLSEENIRINVHDLG